MALERNELMLNGLSFALDRAKQASYSFKSIRQ
jgi:hypothetical protein